MAADTTTARLAPEGGYLIDGMVPTFKTPLAVSIDPACGIGSLLARSR